MICSLFYFSCFRWNCEIVFLRCKNTLVVMIKNMYKKVLFHKDEMISNLEKWPEIKWEIWSITREKWKRPMCILFCNFPAKKEDNPQRLSTQNSLNNAEFFSAPWLSLVHIPSWFLWPKYLFTSRRNMWKETLKGTSFNTDLHNILAHSAQLLKNQPDTQTLKGFGGDHRSGNNSPCHFKYIYFI